MTEREFCCIPNGNRWQGVNIARLLRRACKHVFTLLREGFAEEVGWLDICGLASELRDKAGNIPTIDWK